MEVEKATDVKDSIPAPKKKRVMTEEQLKKLAEARQKANETRAKMAEMKKDEKINKKKELLDSARAAIAKKGRIFERVHFPDSSSESGCDPTSESESDSDSSYEAPKRRSKSVSKPKPKPKPKSRVSSKTTSELAHEIAKSELEKRINDQNYMTASLSLFGRV